MDDLQKESSPAVNAEIAETAPNDVEMEDVSEKETMPEKTKDIEDSNDKATADITEELDTDSTLATNIDKVEDTNMEVLDENKLLEETKTIDDRVMKELKSGEEESKEINELLELSEDKPEVLATVTNSEPTKKVVDIDQENDTLVLDSDVDSEDGEPEEGEEDFDDEENDDHMYDVISEGQASIWIPAGKKGVFYNPVQEFNRDLSVAVLTVFAKDHQSDPTVKKYQRKMKWATATSETEEEEEEEEFEDLPPTPGKKCRNGISVLDALSATGLRAMRYGLEVAGVSTVMANDMSEVAVKIIDKNVKLNNLNKIVLSRQFDAIHLMQLEKIRGRHFDAIDLDPFGNPTRFLDAAVSCVRDGGLLLVTCTDMAVLCGNSPETCYVKYNAVSLKTAACHEMALRICLHLIETVCSKYGRFIVPLLSFHADFYIRVFVKVFTSPQTCKATSTKTSMVFKCIGCNTLSFQPLGMVYQVGAQTKFNLSHGPVVNAKCVHCEGRHVMAGPIWTGPLHDSAFVHQVATTALALDLKNSRRITGMLAVIQEELKDIPLYYTLTNLCSVLHCEVIPMQEFRSALLHANYRVSLSHCAKNSFKTDAPMSVIWDILRCWVRRHPIADKRVEGDNTVRTLISREPSHEANFSPHEASVPESTGLLRYQPNPEPHWGPGRKQTTNIGDARPKSNNSHSHKEGRGREETGESPQAKRFKNSSIELITLSDEDEGDSLDKEIFSLSRKADGNTQEEDVDNASLANINANAVKVNADKVIEEYNLCDDDEASRVTAKPDSKSDKLIEEYNLCDDEDDEDDLRIVNGDIKVTKKDDKTLEDLEKELSQEIDEFDQKTKSALDIVESMEKAEANNIDSDEVILDDLDSEPVAEPSKPQNGDTATKAAAEIAKSVEAEDKEESSKLVESENKSVDSLGDEHIEKVVQNKVNEVPAESETGVNRDEVVENKGDEAMDVENGAEKDTVDSQDKSEKETGADSGKSEKIANNVDADIDKDILDLETSEEKGDKEHLSEEELLKEDGEEVVKENGEKEEEKGEKGKKIDDELDKELDTMISEGDETSKA